MKNPELIEASMSTMQHGAARQVSAELALRQRARQAVEHEQRQQAARRAALSTADMRQREEAATGPSAPQTLLAPPDPVIGGETVVVALLIGTAASQVDDSDALLGDDTPLRDETIIGSGDRAHHLALVAGSPLPRLRALLRGREPLLSRARPASRAQCQRRCGAAGFCDPSSPLGCGGAYCGNVFADVHAL